MGKESVIDTIKGILIFFVNENTIGTVNDISKITGRDRTAIKKYLDFYCDMMILKKYKYGERELYAINTKYKELFKDSKILDELRDVKEE